ncbi:MAG: mechanosensitive ion channel family protein [Polyangiales bacterium]
MIASLLLSVSLLSPAFAQTPEATPTAKSTSKRSKSKSHDKVDKVDPENLPLPEQIEPPPVQTAPATRPWSVPNAVPAEQSKGEGPFFPGLNRSPSAIVFWVFALLILFATRGVLSNAKSFFPRNRALQRLMDVLRNFFGFVMILALVSIVLRLIPADPGVGALVVILGVMGVLTWSLRDLLADLAAGIILVFERRIRPGMWVSGTGFHGSVERRGLRATWLRDGQGHQLAVPNRVLIRDPMVCETVGDTEHEVVVRLENHDNAKSIRHCLMDAVLGSPWVLAGALPTVLRDPTDPQLWRVRSRLLEPRFAVQFEGELLERVEELLDYENEVHNQRITDAYAEEFERVTRPELVEEIDVSTSTRDNSNQ